MGSRRAEGRKKASARRGEARTVRLRAEREGRARCEAQELRPGAEGRVFAGRNRRGSGPASLTSRRNPARRIDDCRELPYNADLRAAGREPMPDVTPHSLRRTFISFLLAAGADVPYVMAQAGHTDPKMTLGLYPQVIASKTDHGAALDGMVGASGWAATGTDKHWL